MGVMALLGFTNHLQVFISAVGDKTLHFLLFLFLTISVYFMWKKRIKTNFILTLYSVLLLTVISECLQVLFNRQFDFVDILCNWAGLATGLFVCVVVDKRMHSEPANYYVELEAVSVRFV